MLIKSFIITNNPMVHNNYAGRDNVIFLEGFSYLKVLETVRDKVHLGHKLVTHPLSGSVKPGETPYKTIVVTEQQNSLDIESLAIVEDSIMTANKLLKSKKQKNWSEKVLKDFQMIDYSLIFSK